ncbi:hypothetical protein CCP4SC76_1060003 [Gammaproteobacteria bacterium]
MSFDNLTLAGVLTALFTFVFLVMTIRQSDDYSSQTDPNTMKNLVASNPNAIGYIDSSALDSSVRVVYAP